MASQKLWLPELIAADFLGARVVSIVMLAGT